MDRNEEAIAWLRPIARDRTQGTGRTHFMLAGCAQRLGRTEEAKQAVATGLKLRPGATVNNIDCHGRTRSPLYVAKADQISASLLQARHAGPSGSNRAAPAAPRARRMIQIHMSKQPRSRITFIRHTGVFLSAPDKS